ncbi:MAG: hypothetical protein ACI9SP_004658 [Arenicella sp.]|jgi:hypothetical protein
MTSTSREIKSTDLERGMLAYGDEIIPYDIIRKEAKTSTENAVPDAEIATQICRKIIIRVHPNQRVVATAPHDATILTSGVHTSQH